VFLCTCKKTEQQTENVISRCLDIRTIENVLWLLLFESKLLSNMSTVLCSSDCWCEPRRCALSMLTLQLVNFSKRSLAWCVSVFYIFVVFHEIQEYLFIALYFIGIWAG